MNNVLATQHSAYEIGACSLPAADYSVSYPVALGDISALGSLRFKSDLCGHILNIDCGNGAVDIVVTNSNLGGGLDLYASTWKKATGYKPPGRTSCSVKLTSKNPFKTSGYKCYHSTGETQNQYYRNVGLLNTNERVVSRATFNGREGAHRGANPYYAFDGYGTSNDYVTFYFTDGGNYRVQLKDCLDGSKKQYWS